MGLNVRFTVAVIVIVIVGFSASAYIFSSQPLDMLANSISKTMIDKSQYIEKIDECLEKQTVGDITLNSFTQKWAFDFKEKIMNAEDDEDLEGIMNEFYIIVSHCKP
jgi:hypothetical protein